MNVPTVSGVSNHTVRFYNTVMGPEFSADNASQLDGKIISSF